MADAEIQQIARKALNAMKILNASGFATQTCAPHQLTYAVTLTTFACEMRRLGSSTAKNVPKM